MSISRALRFVYYQEFGKKGIIKAKEKEISIGNHNFHIDIYNPRSKSLGTIVFMHGMSVKGKADVRIAAVCEALAKAGFLAIAPQYNDLMQLNIDLHQSEQITSSLLAIANDTDLCPDSRLGIMSPSFSASLTLKVSTHSELKKHISSLCLIGGYSDINSTMDYLLLSPDADEFGRLILLKNFLGLVLDQTSKVAKAISLAAIANSSTLAEDKKKLEKFILEMSIADQTLYNRILNEPEYRTELCTAILESPEFKKMATKMDVMPVLAEVTVPITLIHGKHDTVISAEQSRMLHNKLTEFNKEIHLCITDLISHGDTGNVLVMAGEAWSLTKTFAYFFRHVIAK